MINLLGFHVRFLHIPTARLFLSFLLFLLLWIAVFVPFRFLGGGLIRFLLDLFIFLFSLFFAYLLNLFHQSLDVTFLPLYRFLLGKNNLDQWPVRPGGEVGLVPIEMPSLSS